MDAKKEEAKLSELRGKVSDLTKPDVWDDDDDRYFSRWLIARNWNVDKAEAMLRKSMEYRRKMKCDELLSTYKAPEVLDKYYIGGVCGFDREGSPIWLDPLTLLDSRGILHSVTKTQVCLHKLYTCEMLMSTLQSQTRKLNKNVDQIVIIVDVAGLSWKHLWAPGIDCFKDVISIFEDNYPEMLKRTYIINAPKLFILAYNMIKSVLSPRTTGKVQVLGGHWRESLLKEIDADQLPLHYGGTQVDEDGDTRCVSKVLYGGEVPRSYYFTNDDISVDMHSIHIPRSSHKDIECEISVDKCELRYKLRSERHDVGYGFLYKPLHSNLTKHGDMEVVQKVERVNTHMVEQTGVIECHKPGIYVLVLDNSFSWTKGKTVKYSLEVVASTAEGDNDSFSSALDVDGSDLNLSELLNV